MSLLRLQFAALKVRPATVRRATAKAMPRIFYSAFCIPHSAFSRAFTLLELLIVVGIIGILAAAAWPNYRLAAMRGKIAASKNNIRLTGEALEVYRLDQGKYPQPVVASLGEDPYGVIAIMSLSRLTTPVAYIGPSALRDSFGMIQAQAPANDPFRPPAPRLNIPQSLLYFYYPQLAATVGNDALRRECYAMVSVGPDLKDSFIVYYPFPACLPASAAQYGIQSIQDTVYDPSNGAVSGGDLAGFGPEAHTAHMIGGGM